MGDTTGYIEWFCSSYRRGEIHRQSRECRITELEQQLKHNEIARNILAKNHSDMMDERDLAEDVLGKIAEIFEREWSNLYQYQDLVVEVDETVAGLRCQLAEAEGRLEKVGECWENIQCCVSAAPTNPVWESIRELGVILSPTPKGGGEGPDTYAATVEDQCREMGQANGLEAQLAEANGKLEKVKLEVTKLASCYASTIKSGCCLASEEEDTVLLAFRIFNILSPTPKGGE